MVILDQVSDYRASWDHAVNRVMFDRIEMVNGLVVVIVARGLGLLVVAEAMVMVLLLMAVLVLVIAAVQSQRGSVELELAVVAVDMEPMMVSVVAVTVGDNALLENLAVDTVNAAVVVDKVNEVTENW